MVLICILQKFSRVIYLFIQYSNFSNPFVPPLTSNPGSALGYSELIVSVGRHGTQTDQRIPCSTAIASPALC